jgi:hypothetical protein
MMLMAYSLYAEFLRNYLSRPYTMDKEPQQRAAFVLHYLRPEPQLLCVRFRTRVNMGRHTLRARSKSAASFGYTTVCGTRET